MKGLLSQEKTFTYDPKPRNHFLKPDELNSINIKYRMMKAKDKIQENICTTYIEGTWKNTFY